MYNKLISFLALLCLALSATAQQDSAYIFSYFKGNGEDGLHLAYSEDGLKWTALKNDASFLTPKLSPDKLMRDPCIIKGGDGLYHMVWTVSWTQKGIGHATSKDLINWSDQQYIPVMEHEDSTRNSWAPEVTYDPESKEYMIYWASTITGEFPETQVEGDNGYNHRMYYTLTKDFKNFSETMLLYDPGFNSIDATILKKGNKWMMVIKDETREPKAEKNLKLAFADSLEGPYSDASEKITGDYWAEGPTVAKINGEYYVYFDRYMDNHFGLIKSKDLKTWTDISDQLELPKDLRHGTILKISRKELDKLKAVKP